MRIRATRAVLVDIVLDCHRVCVRSSRCALCARTRPVHAERSAGTEPESWVHYMYAVYVFRELRASLGTPARCSTQGSPDSANGGQSLRGMFPDN